MDNADAKGGNDETGMLIRPQRTRILVSRDKMSVLLVFDGPGQKQVRIVLQADAARLLRGQLAGILSTPELVAAGMRRSGPLH